MSPASVQDLLSASPVIAAVRKQEELDAACRSNAEILFILHATLSDVAALTAQAKKAGKCVFIHFDLVDGLCAGAAAVRFLAENTSADGLISTRSSIIRSAKEAGFVTVQRFFVVDSQAEETVLRTVSAVQPDFIELMPGLISPVIARLTAQLSVPVIAGGLIETKESIVHLLSLGASGISTGKEPLWNE